MTAARYRRFLAGSLVIVAAGLSACAGHSPITDYQVGMHIRGLVAHGPLHAEGPPGVDRVGAMVPRVYGQHLFRPLWSHAGRIGHPASELVDVLSAARQDGLNPDAYRLTAIRSLMEGPAPKQSESARLGELDVLLSHAFLLYASHLANGQIAAKSVDSLWFTRPDRTDLPQVLRDALAHDSVRASLAGLAPTQPGYQRLKESYASYQRVAAQGGWAQVPPGPKLARGARGPRVEMLCSRLMAEGDLARSDSGAVFTEAVATAERRFEQRHGQTPDGVVDGEDLAQMNVPIATRLRTLELNLERWRWLPPTFERRYLLVDIPAYTLSGVEDGRTAWTMRVVVGKEFTPTPVFSGAMTYLELNPTWSVPQSIVVNEILPALQRDPGYLAQNHMRVITSDGEPVSGEDVDVAALTSGRLGIRQDSGDDNALGKIKFMFPNRFNIYLHDTPGHHFAEEDRALSHGCIRVERPLDLAEYVLQGSTTWTMDRVNEALAAGATQVVSLPHPLPVHVVYWTAGVDDQGRTQFRDDIYHLDGRLSEALQLHDHTSTLGGETR